VLVALRRLHNGSWAAAGASRSGDGGAARSGWKPAPLPAHLAMLSLAELAGAAGGHTGKPRSARAAPDDRPPHLKYDGLPTHWDGRNVDGVNYVPPVRTPPPLEDATSERAASPSRHASPSAQVRTQGSCGSCYAIAAVAMLEARVRIATGNEQQPRLSEQDVVSCSPYSQGCDGGFPYLVGKYLQDFGVVDDDCFPYAAWSNLCAL
jgi:cathepsin C